MAHPQLIDHETERKAIGAAMLGALLPLSPEDFHSQRNQQIWRVILDLQLRGEVVSWETIAYALGQPNNGELLTYISGCQTTGASTLFSQTYADRIHDLAWRRRLIDRMQHVAGAVLKMEERPEIEAGVVDLMDGMRTNHDIAERINLDSVIDDFLRAKANPRDTWGLVTGIPQIDLELGGLQIGEVFLIAGLPKVGKSMLSSQIGFQLAGLRFYPGASLLDTTPGLMVHLEMSENAILRRAAAALGHVSGHRVRTGKLSEDEGDRFLDGLERVKRAPVFIADKAKSRGWTTGTVALEVRRLQRTEGIQWALIDYAGMLADGAGEASIERDILISQGLARIASLGIAVIAIETLNKTAYSEDTPTAGAVRGSIQKSYDADVISLLASAKDDKDGRDLWIRMAREADKSLKIPMRIVGHEKRFELR